MESTLADIDRDGWELDDAEAIHNESLFWSGCFFSALHRIARKSIGFNPHS
ncbi:Unknown protein sequence [Pseudomonas amygdali pv. myricae]|nr:Unknown protein sequence [Pseudomonas amygdali pv. myricae]RMT47785.1 hypothetical protein ALP46_03568 [Pseudomonas amygdali pv. myricae]RMV05201.1 hypothetical protein ALP18_200091 [Pseudomonas amygdali pv. myricae]